MENPYIYNVVNYGKLNNKPSPISPELPGWKNTPPQKPSPELPLIDVNMNIDNLQSHRIHGAAIYIW